MLKINKTTENLCIVDPDILWNEDLSLTAKGVYAVIMNKQGCKLNTEELYGYATPKEEVDEAIKELLGHGVIEVVEQ